MDPSEAQGIIAKIGKKWKFQQRGLKDQVFKSSGGGQLNQFAMTMVSDSDGALAEATSGDVHFCYFSSSIVLQHKDRTLPRQHDRRIPQGSYQSWIRRSG